MKRMSLLSLRHGILHHPHYATRKHHKLQVGYANRLYIRLLYKDSNPMIRL